MKFDNLTEENYLIYAIKSYDTPLCIMSEFEEDIKRIKYIKRLFGKYTLKDDLKERLIINHIICFYNVFNPTPATRLLFLKIDEKDYSLLKTCLVYLNLMPDKVSGINGKDILSDTIPIDKGLANALRTL